MNARRLIIDCDPGQDDAVALLLAFASKDELDLVGITCVAGNVALRMTVRNALRVRELANSLTRNALRTVIRSATLPATHVIPTRSNSSLDANASKSATASSCPGSQSMISLRAFISAY